MFKKLVFLLLIFFIFQSCTKKDEVKDLHHLKVLHHLGSEKNYSNKKKYIHYFNENYQAYMADKAYRNAAETLIGYGKLVQDLNVGDSVLLNDMKRFVHSGYLKKNDTLNANLYMLISKQLQQENEMDSAIMYVQKAVTLLQNYPKGKLYLDSKNLLAVNYSFNSQYAKAIPIFIELVEIAEKNNNHALLGPLNNNLAYCYDSFYVYRESEKFYKKAGKEFLLAKDTANYMALQSTFIINNFDNEKDTLKTLKLIAATDAIFKKYSKPYHLEKVMMDDVYALKFLLKKNYDSAIFYNLSGITYFTGINNDFLLEYYKMKEAELFFYKYGYLKDHKSTVVFADSTFKNEDFETSKTLYHLLYLDAYKNGEFQAAMKYRDLEVRCTDLISKQNANGKLFEYDKKYQNEKREREIAAQKAEIQLNKIYIITLILFLAVLTLAVWLYLNKLKRDKITEEKNRNNQYIFNLLENIETERNRIAYELHDSVNHSLLNVKNAIVNQKEIESSTITDIIEEVREISRNLYPVLLEKLGLKESIKSLSENFSNDTSLFVTAEMEYTYALEKNRELHLYRIIQESLNNTLKHAQASISKISITEDHDFLNLRIRDNGEGFNVAEKTSGKNSFGLQGLHQRTQALGGSLNISSDDTGTEINLIFPKI